MIEGQEDNIDEEILFRSLSKRHASQHKRYTTVQLIQVEFKSLKDEILSKSKHGQWQGLRRKVGFFEEESFNLIQQAESFLSQLEKNLKATERECNKRMQKIQKQCLQREIKIRSMLDDQILILAQQNKILELSESQLKPYFQFYQSVEEKLKKQKKQQNQLMLNCKIEIEQFKSESRRKIKQINKRHSIKILQLKQKLRQIEKIYQQKIVNLRTKRQRIEKIILEHIQKQISEINQLENT